MTKSLGQVFTPQPIVEAMLDSIGYRGDVALESKLMEPSFGEGIFLLEAVRRIADAAKQRGMSTDETRKAIGGNIHGIELDPTLYQRALESLNNLAAEYGIEDVEWNLHQGDAFTHTVEYAGIMDFVVGNPPYVRIHNIPKEQREAVKQFTFAVGTTDLYVVFFELGLSMLKDTGKLVYITPNAFMKNESQASFRRHLLEENLLHGLVDYRSSKIFGKTGTYAVITQLAKDRRDEGFEYSVEGVANSTRTIDPKTLMDGRAWNFDDASGVLDKQALLPNSVSELASLQYGVMTMRNNLYIDNAPLDQGDGTVLFNGSLVEEGILRPVVKASKYKGGDTKERIIFPYVSNGGRYIPMSEEHLSAEFPLTYAYFESIRDELALRDIDKNASSWFQYGRSQGLPTTDRKKLLFGHILHPDQPLKTYVVPAGVMVYSGFVTMAENDDDLTTLASLYESTEFMEYLKVVGKDMSGGFLAVTPKITKSFRYS